MRYLRIYAYRAEETNETFKMGAWSTDNIIETFKIYEGIQSHEGQITSSNLLFVTLYPIIVIVFLKIQIHNT